MTALKNIVALGLAFLGAASAVPAPKDRQHGGSPVVRVKNGTYSGVHNQNYNQDYFLGIPYAQTPERFTPAQELASTWKGARKADEYPPHCYGYGSDQIGYAQSEDCLYLNVIRPAGIDETAKLPVAVWIHGGGLYMGGSADRRYNLSFIVDRSVEMGTPVIGVSFNYRLSAFGFLCGDEALDAGATNLGFRDQRLALRWINENIASFGGSSDKVTIFGESSGAESVSAQVLAYNGNHDSLFRGAIAESGFGGAIHRYPGGFNATGDMQDVYNQLVANVSTCASLVGTPESLDCLRTAPFEEINQALNVSGIGPWPPVLDRDFIADYPTNQLSNGKIPHIPILIGANTDEGSSFGAGRGPNGGPVNTDEELRDAIATTIPTDGETDTGKTVDELIDELMELYPNDQSIGIPSLETWPHVIQPNDSYAETLGLQYRRTNAFFGDLYFQYTRRRSNNAWTKAGLPSYSYRFDVTVNGVNESAGAVHFQEVAFVYLNVNGDGYAVNPFGGDSAYSTKAKALAKTMSSAWINFFTSQNPNGKHGKKANALNWPAYSTSKDGVGKNIVFTLDGGEVEQDDFRAEGIAWMSEHSLSVLGN